MSTHTIHAAVVRSTGPSLGTICVSALILTIIRLLTLFALFLDRLPAYIPPRAFFLVNGIRLAVGYLDGVTMALSKYALVYSGLTGDPFMPSARRARALTTSVEAKMKQGRKTFGAEPPLTLLTVAPLTLSFPFALLTYLFVAHTLNSPASALGAAVLAGAVTALVGLFCVGLVKDTADTLYVCYCIDKDIGEQKREEVFILFEYDNRNQVPSRTTRQGRPRRGLSSQPEEEVLPLSPRSPPQSPRPTQQQQLPRQQRPQRTPSQPFTEQRAPIPKKQLPQSIRVPITPPPPSQPGLPTPLAPPAAAMDTADDLDPFQLSYAEEQQHTAVPPAVPADDARSLSRSPSPTPSLQLELQPGQQQQQQQEQPPPPQTQPGGQQLRRKSSAEMNMKSHIFRESADGNDVSSDEGEEVGLHKKFMAGGFAAKRRSDSLKRGEMGGSRSGGSERGQGSSQFFPGSGFF